MFKCCSACNTIRPIGQFAGRLGKVLKTCEPCRTSQKKRQARFAEKNPGASKAKSSKFNNSDKGRARKERAAAANKTEEGKAHARELHAAWKNSPAHQAYLHGPVRKALKKKQYERMRADPGKKLMQNARVAICEAMKATRSSLSGRLSMFVGFDSTDGMRKHFEDRFQPWMNWNNHGNRRGNWSVGHRIPQCHFDPTDPDDLRRCWHADNLFPQDHEENLRQNKKLPPDQELAALVHCWPKSFGGVLPDCAMRHMLEAKRK